MTGIIYKALCMSTEKIYIGQTIHNLKQRIKKHFYESGLKRTQSNKFYNAIRKYGNHDFIWEILERFEENDEQIMANRLDEREKFWIDHYDSIKNGYNTIYGSPIKEGNCLGENNPAYVEINVNEEEYFMKANEGWNRQQLANYFGIPDRHMKIWRKRMIAKDPMYKLRFANIDLKRKKKSSDHLKAINKYSHYIEDIKKMMTDNISIREMERRLKIPFQAIYRIIHRDLVNRI